MLSRPESIDELAADTYLFKVGGMAAVVGGFLFMLSNVLHPRSPDIEVYEEQIRTVAASGLWIADHLLLLLGALMIVAGLYALTRSIQGVRSNTWAGFGLVMAVISGAVTAVLAGLDGIASKFVHDSFVAATGADAATALRVSELLEEIDVALFSVFILVFFGLTFLLYGLAIVTGTDYPAWVGWSAIVLSAAALIDGIVQALDGLSTITTSVAFTGIASLLNVWIIVIGWQLFRRGSPATHESPAT